MPEHPGPEPLPGLARGLQALKRATQWGGKKIPILPKFLRQLTVRVHLLKGLCPGQLAQLVRTSS